MRAWRTNAPPKGMGTGIGAEATSHSEGAAERTPPRTVMYSTGSGAQPGPVFVTVTRAAVGAPATARHAPPAPSSTVGSSAQGRSATVNVPPTASHRPPPATAEWGAPHSVGATQ